MSDPCSIQITCAAADAPSFRSLGLQIVRSQGAAVTMEDWEANHAHDGDLPADLIYEGSHGPGEAYDGGQFACDGEQFAIIAVGREGGISVRLLPGGEVCPEDLENWRRLVSIQERVQSLLARLREQPPPELPPLDMAAIKQRAVEAASSDQWLAEKLHQAAQAWVDALQGELPRDLTEEEQEQLIATYKEAYFGPDIGSPPEIISTNNSPLS